MRGRRDRGRVLCAFLATLRSVSRRCTVGLRLRAIERRLVGVGDFHARVG
jgi:hypothetical protein